MDTQYGVYFDNQSGINLTQGEDRSIGMLFYNAQTFLPIDLTGFQIGVNLPLEGGGSIKRSTSGPVFLSSQVVISATAGVINLQDHGLLTGDQVQISLINGSVIPGGLAISTTYYVKFVDVNNFQFTDVAGNVLPITSQGVGSFLLTNSTDIVPTAATLGQIALNLRAGVTSFINAGLAQNFQCELINSSGKVRIIVLSNLLDINAQPVP